MSLVTLPFWRGVPRVAWRETGRRAAALLPKGLYARSILIVILPMVILQSVLTFIFLERHWALVTNRLSTVLTQDLSAIIAIYESYPQDTEATALSKIASERMKIDIEFLPKGPLPQALPKPFFSIVDDALSNEIRKQIGLPFWLDTVGRSNLIEIRIQLPNAILRAVAYRSAAYASNSYIFILWMVGTSFVLIVVAIAFLRTQIRPILRLSRAAEAFGKGREIDFRPRGAREVRQAGYAFIAMKRRIERAIEQRTAMLNGVSHDLRTVITRFKLSLALMGDSEDSEDMKKDVEEMQRMLEGYLAFARGDASEPAIAVDMRDFIDDTRADAERQINQDEDAGTVRASWQGDPSCACGRTPSSDASATSSATRLRYGHNVVDRRHQRRAFPDHPCRRRRARHSRREPDGRVPPVRAARPGAQPGRGRHGPRPVDRARHRPFARRRHLARRQHDGRVAGDTQGAGVNAAKRLL